MTSVRRPEDFPRGSSETNTGGFTRVLFDLPDGQILDAGLRDYGEFFANLDHGWELLHRREVVVNGKPGRISVVHRYLNMVQLKWTPFDGPIISPNVCKWGDMDDAA